MGDGKGKRLGEGRGSAAPLKMPHLITLPKIQLIMETFIVRRREARHFLVEEEFLRSAGRGRSG